MSRRPDDERANDGQRGQDRNRSSRDIHKDGAAAMHSPGAPTAGLGARLALAGCLTFAVWTAVAWALG